MRINTLFIKKSLSASYYVEFLIYEYNSEIFFDMCHNSKFLEISPLEHFYVVVRHVLTSAWVILQVVFEAPLKNPDFG